MLDTDTKRRIDTARDILVGKVPDPKSQVEQITIALIYKFMDDMDAESEEFGGKRKFFAGEYVRYGWAKLMYSGLGGHEILNLYAESITKMPENPGIPPLFRDIFKNAYLPYRDPETLRAFLKIIDEFEYDHSERLGDAFEYLLSVLGSQGDAGQFRTPRHIIDFMVEVIDPKKNETILDPACGTAGFLISSYKHIPPDMVRLSLVNLYLHGFTDPHIDEYDTLTSEEKWNEYADVILANPPFMSPKGGIKPHKRFSVTSKRSEVLFVDYMAEHLTPSGRAGIIVPEGIIFQSQNAYKQLRKMLVEEFLVAVVSLPAGVFNPYSGVKTSILILDKPLAKQSKTIGFFKVENDGFNLGAQRRPIEKNDLPQVAAEIADYLGRLRAHELVEELNPTLGLIVPKEKIAANGEYNLSGARYRVETIRNHTFPLVHLGNSELFRVESGGTPKSDVEEFWNGGIQWATLIDLPATDFITELRSTKRTISESGLQKSSAKLIPVNSIIVSTRATIGRIAINRVPIATNQGFKNVIIKESDRAIPEYVALALTKMVPTMNAWATGGTFKEISKSTFCELQIPLPPLEAQKEIVAEIEGYQKVIDGARAVLDNYRPHISINPDWPMVSLGDSCESIMDGTHFSPTNTVSGERLYITSKNVRENRLDLTNVRYISEEDHRSIFSRCPVRRGDVLYIKDGANTGLAAINTLHEEFSLLSSVAVLRGKPDLLDNRYLAYYLNSGNGRQRMLSLISGVAITRLTLTKINNAIVPLPHLETQQHIVAEIEAEQALVNANRELIVRFEKKIQTTLARVWGGES
jgi:type I restriction enzyme M protein